MGENYHRRRKSENETRRLYARMSNPLWPDASPPFHLSRPQNRRNRSLRHSGNRLARRRFAARQPDGNLRPALFRPHGHPAFGFGIANRTIGSLRPRGRPGHLRSLFRRRRGRKPEKLALGALPECGSVPARHGFAFARRRFWADCPGLERYPPRYRALRSAKRLVSFPKNRGGYADYLACTRAGTKCKDLRFPGFGTRHGFRPLEGNVRSRGRPGPSVCLFTRWYAGPRGNSAFADEAGRGYFRSSLFRSAISPRHEKFSSGLETIFEAKTMWSYPSSLPAEPKPK